METETTVSHGSPPSFNSENYETWAIRMKVHHVVSDLAGNPTVAQLKIYKEKKTRKSKARGFAGRTMPSLKSTDCGSVCQLALFLLAVVAGISIITVGLMMNSNYSPRTQQQPLVIRLNSFSVSDLNVSNSISGANWDAMLLFGNRHSYFEISIESLESFVYYNHQDALSCALVESMHLGPKKQKLVQIKFNASGCGGGEQPFVEERVLKEIKRDGDGGTLHLGLMLNFQVSYRKGPWSWVYWLKAKCTDLDVLFESDPGAGMMIGDEPRSCSVPLLK